MPQEGPGWTHVDLGEVVGEGSHAPMPMIGPGWPADGRPREGGPETWPRTLSGGLSGPGAALGRCRPGNGRRHQRMDSATGITGPAGLTRTG